MRLGIEYAHLKFGSDTPDDLELALADFERDQCVFQAIADGISG